jgi:hypothetical protein
VEARYTLDVACRPHVELYRQVATYAEAGDGARFSSASVVPMNED